MIRLEQPSIAINDPRVGARFHMWRTWTLRRENTSRERIISYVAGLARGANVKNLVINCHGDPGILHLGEGFGLEHTGMFWDWEGLFNTILLVSCETARNEGREFCGRIACCTAAVVIASTELQVESPTRYPYGYIGQFEGLIAAFEPERGTVFAYARNPSTWQQSDGNWRQN